MIPAESFVHEEPPLPPTERPSASVMAAAGALAALSWAGLAWLILNALPTVPNRWLFFAGLCLGLMGVSLPVIQFLHRRFSNDPSTAENPVILIRQAAWVGLFGAALAWLRIPRLLSLPLALILLAALVAIEFFFRLRERAQWRP